MAATVSDFVAREGLARECYRGSQWR